LKSKGLPWEKAKGFDGSAVVGRFVSADQLDLSNLRFSLTKNGVLVQSGHSQNMLHSFADIISYVSRYFTLKTGDLIFTGTPEGVGPVHPGDVLEGYLGETSLFVRNVR
jgi:2-keto-4-pentenoate hydratase/2-oxohepta-3-ene-1,7-dioic acid hydratase in catechol pathway